MARNKTRKAVPRKRDEVVLCLPVNRIDTVLPRGQRWVPWDKVSIRDNQRLGSTIGEKMLEMIRKEAVWVPRTFAEKSADFMQIIPYTIVRKQGSPEILFAYKRTDKTGEPRLIGTLSFGVGGHITQHEDGMDLNDIVDRSRLREFKEEVSVVGTVLDESGNSMSAPIGILNDRDYDVSRVHLGLVSEVYADDISVNETEIIEGGWATIPEIRTANPNLENWATLILYKHLMV